MSTENTENTENTASTEHAERTGGTATGGNTRTVVTPAQISEILVTKAGVDPGILAGNPDISLQDLEIDSLAVLELQAVIVERFGVEIPDHAVTMTVNEISAIVNESFEEVSR
ncbi:acyl carrier protein [Frankia sp. Cas3]|uniref:acyl carrier protein n=1 Tax=Frankia sp. Cas3 TaxID=3073926 RepID=UPI002AD45EF6|nr:acyl carrier protein [Frankia sp. Cas3]